MGAALELLDFTLTTLSELIIPRKSGISRFNEPGATFLNATSSIPTPKGVEIEAIWDNKPSAAKPSQLRQSRASVGYDGRAKKAKGVKNFASAMTLTSNWCRP